MCDKSINSSLVKSTPTWLHPEELKLEVKKYFFCININGTSKRNTWVKISTHFPGFYASLCLCFDSPVKIPQFCSDSPFSCSIVNQMEVWLIMAALCFTAEL